MSLTSFSHSLFCSLGKKTPASARQDSTSNTGDKQCPSLVLVPACQVLAWLPSLHAGPVRITALRFRKATPCLWKDRVRL